VSHPGPSRLRRLPDDAHVVAAVTSRRLRCDPRRPTSMPDVVPGRRGLPFQHGPTATYH
jgi:hypothetical protein